jgi:hypothetical protein
MKSKKLKSKKIILPSKKIWNSFSKEQQKLWRKLYKEFQSEFKTLNYTVKDQYGAPKTDVVCHNLALYVVWRTYTSTIIIQ